MGKKINIGFYLFLKYVMYPKSNEYYGNIVDNRKFIFRIIWSVDDRSTDGMYNP